MDSTCIIFYIFDCLTCFIWFYACAHFHSYFFFSFEVIAMNKTNDKSGSEEVGIGDFDEDDINHDFDPIGKK